METPTPKPRRSSLFPTTRWTRVCAMKGGDEKQAGEALAEWCAAYWQPIYVYLRGRGHSTENAQDLTQGFVQSLIQRNSLARAEQERGRLRSFLLGALKRYLANEYRHAHRQKRGGDAEVLSIDAAHAEEKFHLDPVDDLSPDRLFDRAWSRSVIENVQAELAAEFAARDRSAHFEALQPYLVRGDGDVPYTQIAVELDTTEGAARAATARLRKRFRALFRDHVADTLHEDSDIDDEIRELFAALQ